MFVSANAVKYFFQARPHDAVAFCSTSRFKARAYATGPGTVAALHECGAGPEWIAAPDAQAGQFDSEALWAVVQKQVKANTRVLIVRGMEAPDASGSGIGAAQAGAAQAGFAQAGAAQAGSVAALTSASGAGRDWFAQQVEQAGGTVEFVVAYQRGVPALGMNAMALVQVAAQDGSVWLLSSSEAVANLRVLCPAQDWSGAVAVATHARIASAARALGFGTVLESRPALEDLVASIESLS